MASADQLSLNGDRPARLLEAPPREIPIPTRAPSTTIDQLEKEFARKKQRELEAATRAGGGNGSRAHAAPHRRKSRPQRSLPLRLRQEVQKVPRRGSVSATADHGFSWAEQE